jgi:molybdenum cofactor guanylyltransferase
MMVGPGPGQQPAAWSRTRISVHKGIQPVVLVGGRSSRFGRDKLREPIGGGGEERFLVDASIAALRAVFGLRVAVVGECDPAVAARADTRIDDRYPGVGPIGGILSALEATGADVFVLAGDLPCVTAAVVETVMRAAEAHQAAWAVLAESDRPEPCVGLYRRSAMEPLRMGMAAGGKLAGLIPAERLGLAPVDPALVGNANTPGALRALLRER